MQAKDDHCTDGDIGDNSASDTVQCAEQMYDGKDGDDVDHEVECDMEHEPVLINMPVEKKETRSQCYDADCEFSLWFYFFEP